MPSAAGPPTHRRRASGRATMAMPGQRGNQARDDVARPEEEEADPFQEQEERSRVRDRRTGYRRLAPEEGPGVIGPRRFVRAECPAVEVQQTQRHGDDEGGSPAERLPGRRSDERDHPVEDARQRGISRRDTRRDPVALPVCGLSLPRPDFLRRDPSVRHPSWLFPCLWSCLNTGSGCRGERDRSGCRGCSCRSRCGPADRGTSPAGRVPAVLPP